MAKKTATVEIGTAWKDVALNKNLIARITPIVAVDDDVHVSTTYKLKEGEPTVCVIFESADMETESQYSDPFSGSNPEGKLPSMMASIQSGQLSMATKSLSNAVSGVLPDAIKDMAAGVGFDGRNSVFSDTNEQLKALKNRSNFTKINSKQIFTNSSPISITATMKLVAWADGYKEVEAVIEKLQEWSLAQLLSEQSLVVNVANEGLSEALFPSIIPPIVQLSYGGKVYKPMFIASVSSPLVAPMNANGDRLVAEISVTFTSLTAWDKRDITKLYKR